MCCIVLIYSSGIYEYDSDTTHRSFVRRCSGGEPLMRISRGALLVVLAFSIPILIELRTVLGFFNIELSLTATMLIGAAVLGLIVFWATFPERNQSNATA